MQDLGYGLVLVKGNEPVFFWVLGSEECLHMRVTIFANVICADGGTQHALALGLTPDVVIGDLDSIEDSARQHLESCGTRVISYPRSKDETDLELALLYAVEEGATQVVVLGAQGGRIDHELGNLLLLAHPRLAGIEVRMCCGDQEVLLIRDQTVLEGQVGDLLSLLPIGGDAHGVSSSGLEYALDDETLWFGPARGVSNVFVSPTACVRVRDGVLWAVHTRSF
jgi:thiamine pyrophosphokinase